MRYECTYADQVVHDQHTSLECCIRSTALDGRGSYYVSIPVLQILCEGVNIEGSIL